MLQLRYKRRASVDLPHSAMLERLAHRYDSRISPEKLREELSRLRAEYKISEIDAKAISSAVFKP